MLRRSFIVGLAAAIALSFLPSVEAQSSSKGPVETAPKMSPAPAKSKAPAIKPFDLNSAVEDDLVLAGLDRATVKKVIAARPFRDKRELVSKKLLTEDQYKKVKDLLVAKQPPKPR